MSFTVTVHEDNAGGIYLTHGGETWALGDPDDLRDAEAPVDTVCRAWADGTWAPNTGDGQRRVTRVGDLDEIGTWTDGVFTLGPDRPGAAGSRFLGQA